MADKNFDSTLPRAGNNAIIKINTPDGVVVCGWAQGVDYNENYELQGFRTLGIHGDQGHKSLGYTLDITISTFGLLPEGILNGKIDNPYASETKTIVPILNRKEILTSGALIFDIKDPQTGQLLVSLEQCKMATNAVSVQNNALVTVRGTVRGLIYYGFGR